MKTNAATLRPADAETDAEPAAPASLLMVDVLLDVDLLLEDLGSEPAEPAAAPGPGDGRAALVVDSVPIARKYLTRRLAALGYAVHCAETGERALSMLDRTSYAVVFVEMLLEGSIDGLSLCQAIKQRRMPRGGIAPAVVFATGQASATNRVRGSLAGCDAYLNKPLLEHELLNALRNVDPMFEAEQDVEQ